MLVSWQSLETGEAVGEEEGAFVGLLVGLLVGAFVGLLEGAPVGLLVGAFVDEFKVLLVRAAVTCLVRKCAVKHLYLVIMSGSVYVMSNYISKLTTEENIKMLIRAITAEETFILTFLDFDFYNY